MSKKPRFRIPSDSQHVNGSETLLKSARQQCYKIFPLLWVNFSLKKSLLVISNILRYFVSTSTADGMYSVFNRDNLQQLIQMRLSKKQKVVSAFFSSISVTYITFSAFWKKDDSHSWCISKKNRPGKTWLLKCLKSLASGHPWTVNMLKCSKHCWYLHDSTFITFFIILREPRLENVSLSETWNPENQDGPNSLCIRKL